MMKHELRMRVIGARFTATLVALALLSAGVAVAREYPAAALAGLAMWALGNALIFTAERYLQRWKALKRAEKREH